MRFGRPARTECLMPATELTFGGHARRARRGPLARGMECAAEVGARRRPAARHRHGGRGLRRMGARGHSVRRLSGSRGVDVHDPVRGHPLGVLRHARAGLPDGRSFVRLPADARHGAAHRNAAERRLPARMADPAGRARHRPDLRRHRRHRFRGPQPASAGRGPVRARECRDHRRVHAGRRRRGARRGQGRRATRCGSRFSKRSLSSAGSGCGAARLPSPISRAAGAGA